MPLMTTTLQRLSSDQLASLTGPLKITRPDEAAGRCLSVSLAFALAALQRHGVNAELVKWRVVGDPCYTDHWAVKLNDRAVIDLTRVQVDGTSQAVCAIDSYPANFKDCRAYPASLLLNAYVAVPLQGESRLSNQFAWYCGTRLLQFDLAGSWRARDAGTALATLRGFCKFLLQFSTHGLISLLERRAQTLHGRLGPSLDTPHGDPCMKSVIAPVANARDIPVTRGLSLSQKSLVQVGAACTPALTAHINSACTFLLACSASTPMS